MILRRPVWLMGLAVVALAQPVLVPVSVAELCGMSDVIVDGTIARVGPARVTSEGKIETPATVTVASVWKGPAGVQSLTVIERGGTLPSGRDEVYFHQIIPVAGERYILFLQRGPGGGYAALGGLHGHYRVVNGRIQMHPAMPRILKAGFSNAPVEKLAREVREELVRQNRSQRK